MNGKNRFRRIVGKSFVEITKVGIADRYRPTNQVGPCDFPTLNEDPFLVNGGFQCTRKHLQEMHPDSLAGVKHTGHKS